jgi:hypothetical protein
MGVQAIDQNIVPRRGIGKDFNQRLDVQRADESAGNRSNNFPLGICKDHGQ